MEIIKELLDFLFHFLCCSCLFGGNAAEGNEGGYVDCAGIVKYSSNDLLDSTNVRKGEDGEVIVGNGRLCISPKASRRCRMWTVLWLRWERVVKVGEEFRNIVGHADVHMSVGIVPLQGDAAV